MLPGMRVMGRMPEIIVALQIQPKLRRGAEGLCQTQGHIRSYIATLVDDLGYSLAGDAEGSRGVGNGQGQRLKVVPLKNATGVRRGAFVGNHSFLSL